MGLKVKVCGLCRPEDAAGAVAAGASHIGVVLVAGSRREQSLEHAGEIFAAAGTARRVGVLADVGLIRLREAGEALGLDVLQLHGAETADDVAAARAAGPWSVWKVLRPRTREEFEAGAVAYRSVVDGILVDGYDPGAPGGTGVRAPWALLEQARLAIPAGLLFGLAGGLRPENVAQAVRVVAPDLVDVSSGVESAPCRKDLARVRAFVRAALDAVPDTAAGAIVDVEARGNERGE